MNRSQITEDGVYWMKTPLIDWSICKITFIKMEGYDDVPHYIKPGETWHVPVSHEAEFQGPIPKPS